MKLKHLILIPLLYLTFLGGLPCLAKGVPDDVWVAIRVVDRGVGQPADEYYGTIDKKIFVGMLNTTVPSGFLELEHVAWMENGQIVGISQSKADGMVYGYGDIAYFRVETVLGIIVLDDDFVKEHLLEHKVLPKPSVSPTSRVERRQFVTS